MTREAASFGGAVSTISATLALKRFGRNKKFSNKLVGSATGIIAGEEMEDQELVKEAKDSGGVAELSPRPALEWKKLLRRMIKRIESVPESYDQAAWFIEKQDGPPCGTVACLAGEAIICAAPSIEKGIAHAFEIHDHIPERAEQLLRLPWGHSVFAMDASGWPLPYRVKFVRAKTKTARARIAADYLREALKRGTMVWD